MSDIHFNGAARVHKEIVNKFLDDFKTKYHQRYSSIAVMWLHMNRFQMVKKFIDEEGPIFHPYIDEFLLHKIEYTSKTNPELAKEFFTIIELTTRYEFCLWAFFYARFDFIKLPQNESKFGTLTLYTESVDGSMLTIVTNDKNEVLFISKDVILTGWYYPHELYVEGVALCYVEKADDHCLHGLMNASGEFILPPVYDELGDTLIENNLFKFKEGNKYGYMNLRGEVVLAPVYDYIYGDNSGDSMELFGLLMFEIDNKRGLMKQSLQELLPCIYEDITIIDEDFEGIMDDYIVEALTFEHQKEIFHFEHGKLVRKVD